MKATKVARPRWADKLEGLRQELGWSQAALARKLKVSAMAPSRWERGVNQPPAEIFVQLGKLAGKHDCWYFWERAGLRKCDVTAVLTMARRSKHSGSTKLLSKLEIAASSAAAKSLSPENAAKFLAVPLYATTPAVGEIGAPTIHREKGELVVAPRSWCPHPDQTICVRYSGDKMASMLQQGAIIAVDEADNVSDKLYGKMVLASHDECGLMVHWLQRYGKSEVLVPENKDHPPTYIQNGDWTILGRVLWWFSKAP